MRSQRRFTFSFNPRVWNAEANKEAVGEEIEEGSGGKTDPGATDETEAPQDGAEPSIEASVAAGGGTDQGETEGDAEKPGKSWQKILRITTCSLAALAVIVLTLIACRPDVCLLSRCRAIAFAYYHVC